jgi:transposase-like protein
MTENQRAIRGYSILAKGDTPKLVDKETFLVPSQSSDKKYKVSREVGWVCDCPDFQKRRQACKHIYSVEFLLKLRNKLDADPSLDFVQELAVQGCQSCGSKRFVKNGNIRVKGGQKQRFACKDCKKTFFGDPTFNYMKNPKVVSMAFDLYFKGMSLRKITDTLNQFFGVKIHHETVRRWLMKFGDAMNRYTSQLKPKVSDAWHVDEQVIKSKGEERWVWNVMDAETRFLIANNITDGRSIPEARQVFQKAKMTTDAKPEFMITDGLQAYDKAIKKEYHAHNNRPNRTRHIRLETFEKKPNNNLIERFHSTFRERDKVMRGFKGGEVVFTENFRTYYNFIRPHSALGMTPAEMSGIGLDLDGNKWLNLLSKTRQNPLRNAIKHG